MKVAVPQVVEDRGLIFAHLRQHVGESPLLNSVLKQVDLVAPTDSTVLILGKTGREKN
jgi:transcriptional regulator with GAF, ATPase, and Fis domain